MAARKKAARKRNAGRSSKNRPASEISLEVRLCVVLACAILIFISNIGFGGPVGHGVSYVLFGLFGIMAYAFPLFLFFGYVFYIANLENPLVRRKTLGLVLLFVFLCVLLHLVTEGYDRGTPIADYFILAAEDHAGGGFLGGVISFLLARAFGLIGAYILTLIAVMISVLILTQHPLIRSVKRTGSARTAAKKTTRKTSGAQQYTSDELRAVIQQELKMEKQRAEKEEKKEQRRKEKQAVGKEHAEKAVQAGAPVMPDFLRKISRSGNPSSDGAASAKLPEGKKEGAKKEAAVSAPDAPQQMDIPDIAGVPFDDPVQVAEKEPAGLRIDETAPSAGSTFPEKKADHGTRRQRASASSDVPASAISAEMQEGEKKTHKYRFPSVDLLTPGGKTEGDSRQHLMETAAKLQQTLRDFGVNVRVVNVSRGPSVTRYELQPEQGVKVSRIINLSDDIKLNLAASDIRIEAPIPGKAAVGIEVPNKTVTPVMLRDLFETPEFRGTRARIPFAVGRDIAGKPVIADIEKMPHLLIAGATGSGKSVCINTIIMSILYKARPDEVKMLMIDPKVVELKIYDGIPHLLIPVVTDARKAAGALNWAVQEMTERYNTFAGFRGVRDIRAYNQRVDRMNETLPEEQKLKRLPQIVIIVDELADLMMVASHEVEDAICRLAQLARAAGIHLIIATQRPSVNVVTGLIKANMPSRIALAVASGVDSRTILDMNGAEKLLGKGDMLFYPQDYPKPARVQGAFVSDEDITNVVKMLSQESGQVVYNTEVEEKIREHASSSVSQDATGDDDRDAYFADAGKLIIEKDKASIGMLQRAFKIGFNRAARIMDQLCEAGVVGEEEGTKPRKILMTKDDFEQVTGKAGGKHVQNLEETAAQ